jgi:outer membrane protein TolC
MADFLTRFVVLLSALLLAPTIAAQAQPPAKDATAQLKSLLEERRDALDKAVQMLFAQYRAGTVNLNRLLHALHRLGDAELDLAKGKDERTAACQRQVALCRDVTKICQARLAAGRVSEIDVCDAIAEQTTAEIQLLREKAGDNAAQMEVLIKDRQLALEKVVEIRSRQYGAGTVDFNGMALGESQLAEAELELAKNKGERIAVCQKQIESCRDVEKICQKRFDAGSAGQVDVLEATAERLKAEIQLMREKAAEKPAANSGP